MEEHNLQLYVDGDEHRFTAGQLAMMHTDEFDFYVRRMMVPLEHGFIAVKSEEFFEDDFLDNVHFDDFPPTLFLRARAEALKAFQTYEALLLDSVELAVLQDMERMVATYSAQLERGELQANAPLFCLNKVDWNASDAEEMDCNLECFVGMNFSIWEENELIEYCDALRADSTLTEAEKEHIIFFVKEFVGSAMAAVPRHGVLAEGIYFDAPA